MSVINQMLKELDERNKAATAEGNASPPRLKKSKSNVQLLIIVIVLIFLNVLGWFVWKLYTENQSLKHIQPTTDISGIKSQGTPSAVKPTVPVLDIAATVPAFNPPTLAEEQAQTLESTSSSAQKQQPTVAKNRVIKLDTNTDSATKQTTVLSSVSANTATENNAKSALIPPSTPQPARLAHTEDTLVMPNDDTPTLAISRRELLPEEFAEKKYQDARKAVQLNELKKAELALEEVLLVQPSHKAARKQLAALWFGRQSYQAALNLLAQGLSLDEGDEEMRLMQARIYLSQGQAAQALAILKVKPDILDKTYQSLLASTAQELGKYDTAIRAYRHLTEIEPLAGRWWLGLAITYDRNAQFDEAKEAYRAAIKQKGISNESLVFATQRLVELGD